MESIRAGLFETLNNTSISLIALGDFTGALTYVDRCLSTGLVKGSVYVLRSLYFLALDRIDEGLFDIEIALKLDPQSKHALELREAFNRAAIAQKWMSLSSVRREGRAWLEGPVSRSSQSFSTTITI